MPEPSKVAVTAAELIKVGIFADDKRDELERYFEARRRFDELFGPSEPEFKADEAVQRVEKAQKRYERELRQIEEVMDHVHVLTKHDPSVVSGLKRVLADCFNAVTEIDPGDLDRRIRRARDARDELLRMLLRIHGEVNGIETTKVKGGT
jgi:hypothetical protein